MTLAAVGLLSLVAVGSPAPQVPADDDGPPLALDARIDQFWKLWETEQPSEALRRLSSSPQSPWANLYQVVDGYHARLGGKALGHVQIERKKVTDRIEFVSFYEYYDVQPVRVELLYYKARNRWEGIACHVDINSSNWLHEIAHPQEVTLPQAGAQQGDQN
jgi:hypothetical protein